MTDRITSERDLIETYLAPLAAGYPGAFGLADDAAAITPPPGCDLVVSNDPVIAGIHFFSDDSAADIAWKALAVNISDLVAKGARPLAYTMALALPGPPTRSWMADFSTGLGSAQNAFGCHLVGGDTDHTSGPLSIGITAFGIVEHGAMIPRARAQAGDHVFVTGTIGDAALGLVIRQASAAWDMDARVGDRQFLIGRYLRPEPRVRMIDVLRRYARSSLDISDGLIKDLGRLAGDRAIDVRFDDVPLSSSARTMLLERPSLTELILTGGGDYEVLFAVSPEDTEPLLGAARSIDVGLTRLGVLSAQAGRVSVSRSDGSAITLRHEGYDHFSQL